MAEKPRNTPNPFEIFGTASGTQPDPFNIFDTYRDLPKAETSEELAQKNLMTLIYLYLV